MTAGRLAVVHNNIDGRSSIGSVAAWHVREALARGWQVTAVSQDLDPGFCGSVAHSPLYVPPRAHLLQWSVARPTVRRALRGVRADVLVVHQPQLASMADVWNVHYLSRAAREKRGALARGARARSADLQAAGVARLEDQVLRRLVRRPDPRLLFCSEGLLAEYTRLYGTPRNATVLHNPAIVAPRSAPRRQDASARRAVVGDHEGPVIGFLGGGDVRKGGDRVVEAVRVAPELFLVHAGAPGLDDASVRALGRSRGLGALTDVTELLDIVDVLAVPSRFEPFGLVVAEAAARGVPSVVTVDVGVAPLVLATGAGRVWDGAAPLARVVRELLAHPEEVDRGTTALVAELDPSALADRLFAELDLIRDRAPRGGRQW